MGDLPNNRKVTLELKAYRQAGLATKLVSGQAELLAQAYESYKKSNEMSKAFECAKRLYRDGGGIRIGLIDCRKWLQSLAMSGTVSEIGKINNLMFESYKTEAPDNFESFMLAMEWKRPNTAKFYLPRRRVLEDNLRLVSTIDKFINKSGAKKLCLSMPPGTGKTTLIKFMNCYIAGRNPASQNMYCSYASGMTDMMLQAMYDMMTSDEYAFSEIFPPLPKVRKSAEYSTLTFREGGDFPTFSLVALGGSVTGRTRANNFFITDDLVKNDEMARSPERLENLWNDYSNTLTTRMIGNKVKEIMLGTIWSLYDPISRDKAKNKDKPGRYYIAIPVCDEEGHSNFKYDHPDNYTDEMVADLKDKLDPIIFSCVYMQQGIEKEGLAFSKDSLRWYNGVLPEGEPDNVFFHADVAWGGGDSFAMPILYVYGQDVYMHDCIFNKGDKTVTQPLVINKILSNNIKMGNFEANAGGSEYRDNISDKLYALGYSMNLTSKRAKNNINKVTRIEQHQSTIRNIYFRNDPERGLEYRLFMDELMRFSFTSENKHDDAPDALAGACEYKFANQSVARITKRQW